MNYRPRTVASERAAASRLINLRTVCELTSLSRVTVYDLINRREFPKPLQLAARRIAFREADIVQWLDSRREVTWAA